MKERKTSLIQILRSMVQIVQGIDRNIRRRKENDCVLMEVMGWSERKN